MSNRRKAPRAALHFVSLTDFPVMEDGLLDLVGQRVPAYKITWQHVCVPECADYDIKDDPFIFGVPASRNGFVDIDGDYVFGGAEIDPFGRSVLSDDCED
jgi:hypothetical protein